MFGIAVAAILYSMPWSAALDRKQLDGPDLSIVQFKEFLKPAVAHVGRNNIGAKGNWACSDAPATVLQSTAFKAGTTKTIMVWRPPGDHQLIEAHVNRATRYLLLSVPTVKGDFKVTNGSHVFHTSLVLTSGKPQNEMALLLFPTRATAFSTGLKGADLVEDAILDCLDPENELSYQLVVRLLCRAHPDWEEKARARDGWNPDGLPSIACPPGPLVEKLRRELKRAKNAYENSRVLELMVRWHVPGSVTPYFESIRALLRNPDVYADEDELQLYWGLIGTSGDSLAQSGREIAQFDRPYIEDAETYISDILSATNPALLIYWMNHCSTGLDDSQKARYAALLDWNDRRVLYEVCETLANWTHEPEHSPKLYGSVRGVEVPYPDLKEVVAYWKKRFHVVLSSFSVGKNRRRPISSTDFSCPTQALLNVCCR